MFSCIRCRSVNNPADVKCKMCALDFGFSHSAIFNDVKMQVNEYQNGISDLYAVSMVNDESNNMHAHIQGIQKHENSISSGVSKNEHEILQVNTDSSKLEGESCVNYNNSAHSTTNDSSYEWLCLGCSTSGSSAVLPIICHGCSSIVKNYFKIFTRVQTERGFAIETNISEVEILESEQNEVPSVVPGPVDIACTDAVTTYGVMEVLALAVLQFRTRSQTDRMQKYQKGQKNNMLSYLPSSIDKVKAHSKTNSCRYSMQFCSVIPHITQRGVYGSHWSCGYRNIQMLCISLMQLPQYASCLFHGSGKIPDLLGIQGWIENAWLDGFDPVGCAQLGGKLRGTQTWIGATECCALLRYFGIRASIVDFVYKPYMELDGSFKKRKMADSTADSNSNCDLNGTSEQMNAFYASKMNKTASLNMGIAIARWLQNYFTDVRENWKQWSLTGDASTTVCLSEAETNTYGQLVSNFETYLPPLYLQHQGHSRTIIGYEVDSDMAIIQEEEPAPSSKHRSDSESNLAFVSGSVSAEEPMDVGEKRPMPCDSKNVLGTQDNRVHAVYLFDPSHSGVALKQNLEDYLGKNHNIIPGSTNANTGENTKPINKWSKMVKRSLSSFSHRAYQIVYVLPGIMSEEERACLKNKTIDSVCMT